MLRRVQVTFDCADPLGLAGFWAAVLGYPPPDPDAPGSDTWVWISDPDRRHPGLFFQRVPEPKAVKNRVHLDVRNTSGAPADIDGEVIRLVALGAVKLHGVTDDSGYFVVMQDPEGNEFCID
jgi:hypothetical protein